MKGLKEDIINPLIISVALLTIPLGIQGYISLSGFRGAYNGAIERNADINHDGKITPIEEWKFKQELLQEIREHEKLSRNINSLNKSSEEIVNYLKNR